MAINLEELGMSKEELQERVVESCCRSFMNGYEEYDEDGGKVEEPSVFRAEMQKLIKKQLTQSVKELAEAHVLPNVALYVENLTLEQTNQWGEKIGKKLTFIEYLVSRADAYLREDVNYEGESKDECGSYPFSKSQSRLTHLLNRHLHYSIETAMKDAVNGINSVIVPAIEKTVKTQLEQVVAKLKVNVQP